MANREITIPEIGDEVYVKAKVKSIDVERLSGKDTTVYQVEVPSPTLASMFVFRIREDKVKTKEELGI
jgi:hypothetical protein